MREYERIECTECNWAFTSKDRIDVLESGFYHVIGQGHDVTRQEEMEEEFGL